MKKKAAIHPSGHPSHYSGQIHGCLLRQGFPPRAILECLLLGLQALRKLTILITYPLVDGVLSVNPLSLMKMSLLEIKCMHLSVSTSSSLA